MMNRRNLLDEMDLPPLPAFQIQPGAGYNTFNDPQAALLPPPSPMQAQPVGYSPQQALMGGGMPSRPLPSSEAPQQDLGMEILKTYVANKQSQMDRSSFVQDILSKRFEPTQDDIVRTNLQNTQAALLPESYKTTTATDTATSRLGLELAPYSLIAKMNGADAPASVQEYQYYNNLSPEQRLEYLKVKRNPTFVNLGDRVMSSTTGDVIPKGIPPQSTPEIVGAQAKAREYGKQQGEATSNLTAAEAAMPQLEESVRKLSEIGKEATYTAAGQGVNEIVKQSGLGATPGAVARSKYIAHVKNNVLPLLRRTFGAQFTKAEGDSLLATLGDPNMAPAEKDAVLQAFIEDKKATVGTMRREIGLPSGGGSDGAEINFEDLPD